MYHVVTTYNGGEAKIYLNSQLVQTSTTGNVGSITDFSADLRLGGGDVTGEFYLTSGSAPIAFNDSSLLGICAYEGFLDEFRVYQDKVLYVFDHFLWLSKDKKNNVKIKTISEMLMVSNIWCNNLVLSLDIFGGDFGLSYKTFFFKYDSLS